VIITAPELQDAAQAFADYRASQGSTPLVVTYPDVVDAFNDGIGSPWAVQRFLEYAWNVSGGTLYALIAGAGHYDYRDLQGVGGNLVPPLLVGTPFGLYAADNLLADVTGDDGMPEFPIGRVPALTPEELSAYRDKVQLNDGPLTERALMAADDGDVPDFAEDSETVAARLTANGFVVVEAYQQDGTLDAAAATKATIIDQINTGVGLVHYFGHAGVDHLASPKIFDLDAVDQLVNTENCPVFLGFTCNVARFDLPGQESLAGATVLREGGGAVAFWGPTHFSDHGQAKALSGYFLDAVLGDGVPVLGDAVVRALNAMGPDGLEMHSTYSIIGDPALRVR